MMKILTVLGARPQIIKSAAITRVVRSEFEGELEEVVLNTGQHYDSNMSTDFFKELFLPVPKYDQSIDFSKANPISQMIEGVENAIIKENPNVIIVYGDTTSTLAGAISAAKFNIPLVHIEAGLRSFNISMPEEGNRILTDHSSRLLFTPTLEGMKNLKNEKINDDFIFHCGDVMYDNSLFYRRKANELSGVLNGHGLEKERFILFTCHRQGNTDIKENLLGIIKGVKEVARISGLEIVFPMHPRTRNRIIAFFGDDYLKDLESDFKVIPPASFLDTIQLESNASFVMTDSGGIQKEAYFFEKMSIILRDQTEWVEIIKNDAAVLAGSKSNSIVESYQNLKEMKPKFEPIFGDGEAGKFICKTILEELR